MNLRVPDSLTASLSEKYRTSVRLWPGGLSFSGAIPTDDSSFFYEETAVDVSRSYAQVLRDACREYPFLTYPYADVRIVCSGLPCTLVPEVIYQDEAKERIYRFTFARPAETVIAQTLQPLESVLLFGLRHDVHAFVERSLPRARWSHVLTSLLLRWRSQSLVSLHARMHALIHERTMDLACFDRGNLRFINRFEIENYDDIMYYLLYIWKQLALDQRRDVLTLSAVSTTAFDLKEQLQTYLQNIRVEAIQELYRADDREATVGSSVQTETHTPTNA